CLLGGEQCDDGNLLDGDGCDATCHFEHCGDGVTQPEEGCDDGNTTPCDGCTECRIDFCSDGRLCVQRGEQCDDFNQVNGDGCDANCQFEPVRERVSEAEEHRVEGNDTPCEGRTMWQNEGCGHGRDVRLRVYDGYAVNRLEVV